jgi:hypothetical protein
MGSTAFARRAGMQLANTPMPIIIIDIDAKTRGSTAFSVRCATTSDSS